MSEDTNPVSFMVVTVLSINNCRIQINMVFKEGFVSMHALSGLNE